MYILSIRVPVDVCVQQYKSATQLSFTREQKPVTNIVFPVPFYNKYFQRLFGNHIYFRITDVIVILCIF